MKHLIALLAFTGACAEPVVEMELVMPKMPTMNPSCISAFEVHANGATFPSVQTDVVSSCVEITAGSTYESVRDAIKGKFQLGIPDTGLSSVEIYGWSGPAPCAAPDPFFTPDLLFYGNADYIGQDTLELPIVPNIDCTLAPVTVQSFDMFALANGATCANAVPVDPNNGVGTGTLVPRAHDVGLDWYGNLEGADFVNNVASFNALTHVGPKTCLAIDVGSDAGGSLGCVIGGNSVCATNGAVEAAYIPAPLLNNLANYDATLNAKFPGVIWGTVWNNAATKTPIAGATVDVDAMHGKVVYVDPPATGGTALTVRSTASTGASGMFVIYADSLVNAKINANGATRTVTLGTSDGYVAAAMIVMP